MKSGIYFVEAKYREHFLRRCEKYGHNPYSGNSWNAEIKKIKNIFNDKYFTTFEIDSNGFVDFWYTIEHDNVNDEYKNWNTNQYKEIYKPNRLKITI